MAVLPESMDRLNIDDSRASLSVIENYIRYMGERIEFAIRNTTKAVSAAGISNAEIYTLIQAQSQQLAALSSTANNIIGDISSIQRSINEMRSELLTQQQAISDLNEKVAALEAR